ncbi:MAG: hypothetical protein IMY72_02610 [Bacteroidetes bacterium]|nr:hypothetical protein [Bacteroidota bacterium]
MKKIQNLLLILLTVIFVLQFEIVQAQELSIENKIIFKKAEKQTHKKKYLTAIHYYEQILKNTEHIETLMKIADLYFVSLSQKNYYKALEFYKRAENAINIKINKNSKFGRRNKTKGFKQTCSNNIKICLLHIEKFDDAKKRHRDAKNRLDKDNTN